MLLSLESSLSSAHSLKRVDDFLPIASKSLLCADSIPIPYVIGIETPNIPRRQYILSSLFFVFRPSTQLRRSAMLKLSRSFPRRASIGILVILLIYFWSDLLSPSLCPSRE